MRIVIIGGRGHTGTFLVPHHNEAGHEVLVISRGQRRPYRQDAAWQSMQHLLHCGTIWVHGPGAEVPTTEAHPRTPFGVFVRP